MGLEIQNSDIFLSAIFLSADGKTYGLGCDSIGRVALLWHAIKISDLEDSPSSLLFNGYCDTSLELLVLALVVAMHFMMTVLPPHPGIVHSALLVIDPHMRAIVAVVIRDIRNVHLLL